MGKGPDDRASRLTPKGGYFMRAHMFLSQAWLNEARTSTGLSPTMDFFNENDSLAYFAVWGELYSGLYITVGFFKTKFSSLLVCSSRGQGKTYLATPKCFSWLKRTKYPRRIFLGFLD